MSEAKYIVIRKSSGGAKRPGRLTRGVGIETLRSQSEGIGPAEPDSLTIQTLNDREAADLRRDPNILASSRSIPISLVKPLSAQEAASTEAEEEARKTGASWGVRAIAPNADTRAGSSVTVAVLDTGIDLDHPAFKGVSLLRKNFS